MKNLFLFLFVLILGFGASAQTNKTSQTNTQLDSTAVFLLQRINQHTAPCYKLYKTENMWTFLELETFSGKIWQIQYSVEESTPRLKTALNYFDLTESTEISFAGRFELYPTQNMYNFILLDTFTGKTWQAQWSTNYENRGIIPIE